MKEAYYTIRQTASAEITIKHSRFIATAVPVSSYDNAMQVVANIRHVYSDATHNCYAFIADVEGAQCKCSDDGEPQGTAGAPMLEVLRRQGLTCLLVVVTRYFGGIKLGASGLVGAYTQAVGAVLEVAQRVCRVYCAELRVRVDYALIGKLPQLVQRIGGVMGDIQYDDDVFAVVAVPADRMSACQAALSEWSKGTAQVDLLGYAYRELS